MEFPSEPILTKMLSPNRIIIFGASGFIGKNLVKHFSQCGHEIIAVSRNWAVDSRFICENVTFVNADLRDPSSFQSLLDANSCVIDLAYHGMPSQSAPDAVQELQDNLVPHINLIQKCVEKNVMLFLYGSSGGAIYGNTNTETLAEDHACETRSIYAATKLSVESFTRAILANSNTRYVNLRFANPYGPHQNLRKGVGLIARIFECVKRDEDLLIYGDGSAVRDYIHIQDLCLAVSAIINAGVHDTALNIGTGVGHSINDVIHIAQQVIGQSIPVKYVTNRSYDANRNVLCCEKLLSCANWKATITLEQGMKLYDEFLRGNAT
jgi:UDP-glucose 4-epimerase